MDAQVGRLLDAVDNSAQADNTLIVLFSDHGWHLGEKQHWGKWTGWERSTRVPLVIVPPRIQSTGFQLGTNCHQPVSLVDIFPTLLELCNLPARPGLDGQSLRVLLTNPDHPTRPVITTFDHQNYSIRDERWRLIRYQDGSQELYDHQADPHEWNNLAGDPRYAAVVQRLSNHLPRTAAESL